MTTSQGIVQDNRNASLFTLACWVILGMLIQFTMAIPASAQTATPIFYESFDSFDSITANGGVHSNITLAPGKSGTGALIQANGSLVYPAQNNFNFPKGTIEFWIKPNWDGGIDLGAGGKHLLTIYEGTNFWSSPHSLILPIVTYSASLNQNIQNIIGPTFGYQGNRDRFLQSKEPYSVMQWSPGTWHQVVLFWDFTLPDNADGSHNSYLVAKIDGTYTTCKKVAPVGSEGISGDSRIVIGQDHVLGRYPAEAVIDELKIYDTSLLPVIPFPEYQYNPFYPSTETTLRNLFKNDGFTANFETYGTDPAECPKLSDSYQPKQKVFFFKKPAFEPVYENCVPQTTEIGTQFNYQAPIGEYITLFFNVYTRVDLNNAKVNYTEFQGTGGTIPKGNLDLRVVKNWFQAARGASTEAEQLPVYLPGLLLHNDQIPLETDQTLSQYKVPSLPLLTQVQTKISQYTAKQFAMIVKVPEGAAPGTYQSAITLSANGLGPQRLTLNLEVLPFSLMDSGKSYTIWQSIDGDRLYAAAMGLDIWEILQKDLTDIKNHGINSVIFYAYNDGAILPPLTALQVQSNKVAAAQQLGFKKAVIYTGTRPETLNQDITDALTGMMMSYGFEPWLYAVDEFGPTNMDYQITKSMAIRGVGGKVVTTSSKANSEALDDPNNPVYGSFPPGTCQPLDWAIYPTCDKYLFDLMAKIVQKNPNKIESYYWQCRDFQLNRYFFGYLPWITGLDGPAIHPYRNGGSKGQYYNDFDWSGPTRRFRPYLLGAPSTTGPVPTFQWEAVREGILDGKYLATWKYYKDEAAKTYPALAQQSETVVNNILESYTDRARTANTAAHRVSMAQYEADRNTIINEIKNLKFLTNP